MKKRNAFLVAAMLALGLFVQPQSALPVAGQWGVIFSIDAPWRLEPFPGDGAYAYGRIPVVISFRQASNEAGRQWNFALRSKWLLNTDEIGVGKVTAVRVTEIVRNRFLPNSSQPAPQPTIQILPTQFREVERKRVLSTKQNEPTHELCRPFLGQQCDNMLWVTETDEWHGMFWYTPQNPVVPGRNIHLQVTVITESGEKNRRHEWTSYLVVHAGEQSLPRFTDSWLYGDLHYHSQMTANEGEYGYSYRNVVRALGALGMDFLFTTDHASNGQQMLGEVTAGRCGTPVGSSCSYDFEGGSQNSCKDATDGGKTKQCMLYKGVEARDLNANKFAMAKSIIYGPDGANDAVARDAEFGFGRLRSANVLPQIYMGEEVDAWPEMSSKEQQEGFIYYGDNLKYSWPNGYESDKCLQKESLQACRSKYSTEYTPRDHRSYGVLDEQGLPIDLTLYKGNGIDASVSGHFPTKSRQHLVYLPVGTTFSPDGWIASDTGNFGGASKQLAAVLSEVETNRGYVFLAHPLRNGAPGATGPDVVPYSDIALDRGWSSPAVLGLQFWNEDDHYYSTPSPSVNHNAVGDKDFNYNLNVPYQLPWSPYYLGFPWRWDATADLTDLFNNLYHSAFTWDRYLRKGLNPNETKDLSWLPKGSPRKWFMAGGSDAHGDLNYRQQGDMCPKRWCTTGVVDTAIGKPRNLVLVSQPPSPVPGLPNTKRYSNGQVIDALKAGQFSVTDGPAIRIAIDKNRNGKIDAADFQMGSTFDLYPGEQVPLIVEWISSPEFGPIQEIDVYVGTSEFTFASKGHGPLQSANPITGSPGRYRDDPTGTLKVLFPDGNYSAVSATVPPIDPVRYHGKATLLLNPAAFGLSASDLGLFYFRAFARTVNAYARLGTSAPTTQSILRCASAIDGGQSCGDRLAYTNPIWGRSHAACPPKTTKTGPGPFHISMSLDGDNNGYPDICERDIPDLCPLGQPEFGSDLSKTEKRPLLTAPIQASGPRRSCQMVGLVDKTDRFDSTVPDVGGGVIKGVSPRGLETESPGEASPGSSESGQGTTDRPTPESPEGIKSDPPRQP